jgi:hypothetical protein
MARRQQTRGDQRDFERRLERMEQRDFERRLERMAPKWTPSNDTATKEDRPGAKDAN